MIWPFTKKRKDRSQSPRDRSSWREATRPAGPSKFQLGNRAFVAQRYDQAITFFSAHADEFPADYAKCHTRIAECCLNTNALAKPAPVNPKTTLVFQADREGAESHYRLAIDRDADYTPALLGLAALLPPASDERFRLLKHAADVDATFMGLIELGDFYRSVHKDHLQAYETYRRAQEKCPKDGTGYQRLQDICRRMNRNSEASEWAARWKDIDKRGAEFRKQTERNRRRP